MFETKYSKFLTVLLIVIIVAIIGLLGFLGYKSYKNHKNVSSASEFVDAFTSGEDNNKTKGENKTDSNSTDENSVLGGIETTESSSGKKRKTYGGFDVSATIEIPKINLSLPILSKETKKSLETAVAVRYPENAVLNTEGNVVIAGHNYRNGTFFSNLKKVALGDTIYITDLDGKKIAYSIYNIFEAAENDTSFYNRDTNGAKEITLTTCTDDSTARLIVEAKANE